jgi:hypothetical protein
MPCFESALTTIAVHRSSVRCLYDVLPSCDLRCIEVEDVAAPPTASLCSARDIV